jgi:hypothetical protein
MQPYVRAAKCGKDMPKYSGGKKNILNVTPEDMFSIPGMDTRTDFDKRVDAMDPKQMALDYLNFQDNNKPTSSEYTQPATRSTWGGVGNAIASGLTALGGLS